jgi:hypothetical protein
MINRLWRPWHPDFSVQVIFVVYGPCHRAPSAWGSLCDIAHYSSAIIGTDVTCILFKLAALALLSLSPHARDRGRFNYNEASLLCGGWTALTPHTAKATPETQNLLAVGGVSERHIKPFAP